MKSDPEYEMMLFSLDVHNVKPKLRSLILQAYNAVDWDWHKSDGCTLVSEVGFPFGYRFPPCVLHDWLWWRVKNKRDISAAEANLLFYQASVAYGMTNTRSWVRKVGVTFGWLFWFKWKKPKN
jgi:hypothetical protein